MAPPWLEELRPEPSAVLWRQAKEAAFWKASGCLTGQQRVNWAMALVDQHGSRVICSHLDLDIKCYGYCFIYISYVSTNSNGFSTTSPIWRTFIEEPESQLASIFALSSHSHANHNIFHLSSAQKFAQGTASCWSGGNVTTIFAQSVILLDGLEGCLVCYISTVRSGDPEK